MNPYDANPANIPPTDRYRAEPFNGRYLPRADDFKPEPAHVNSTTPESLKYWASVLQQCDESVMVYDNQDGGRDVFALGTVIIKSSHLKKTLEGRRACRDYSFADANEVAAIAKARDVLGACGCQVPKIYFADKIEGRDVLVQERIPGVGLNVAWQYLSPTQKASFKQQARAVLRLLASIKSPSPQRSYLVPDPDPVEHRGIQDLERDIIFSGQNEDRDFSLMHNDFTQSNCIVDNDKIVGLVDWEMAGWFGWKTAGRVHREIRSPRRETYARFNRGEERMSDILFWNDLYDDV